MKFSSAGFALVYSIGSALIGAAELTVGILSGSLALVADSVHVLTDVISGVVSLIAGRVGGKGPDREHPFGHSRAEPLGAFFVAVLTALLGLNLIQMGIVSLIEGKVPHHGPGSYYVLSAVLAFKIVFYLVGRKQVNQPIIHALSVDSRNDSLASGFTLLVIFLSQRGIHFLDNAFALVLGGFILYSGFELAKCNISLLMGEVPERAFFDNLTEKLERIPELRSYDRIKAHFVGQDIHLAFTAYLDPNWDLARVHLFEHRLLDQVKTIPRVAEVFIHFEPDGALGCCKHSKVRGAS